MNPLYTLNPLQTDSEAKAAVGATQGVRRTTGVAPTAGRSPINETLNAPDPEVAEKKTRRRFTAAYKLRVLQQAEQCTRPGEIGALLRQQGLYSSHLTTWRRQFDDGVLQGLNPKKRGRKNRLQDPSAVRLAQVERENQRLKHQLRKAEIIIEAQKKISEILGIDQNLDGLEDYK